MLLSKKEPSVKKKRARKRVKNQVFPIVAIGASAGGLEPLKTLIENLPDDTGLAFVVVQHLASNQESMLRDILSRYTKMVVQKIENNMQVQPNHIYVIPSGQIITIKKGNLKLEPKERSQKAINIFFQSLAEEHKTRAIGVILSGTGSDGTEGLKTIKAEGGITFVQDPQTAAYSDMPRNAISADTAYYIISAKEIAKELVNIANHPELSHRKIEAESEKSMPEESSSNQKIFGLLKKEFNVSFTHYKKPTVNRRISRRMVINHIENKKEYVEYLRTHTKELKKLFDDLLINVTGFFREKQTFSLIKETVLPDLLEKKQLNEPLRVWVPGCSTGEEVYSIAIIIKEFFEEKNIVDKMVQIFGTDINDKNVNKARQGIYPSSIKENVTEKRLKRFFTTINGSYQVSKQIRDLCVFAKHDISSDPPFSKMDLILCRNMLIYFDIKLQEKIIPILHYGLNYDGYLVLGQSESIGKYSSLFKALTPKGIIFRKKVGQPATQFSFEKAHPRFLSQKLEVINEQSYLETLENEIDHILLSEYAPASLVLNNNLDVIFFRGDVNSYISMDSGIASLNITKIVRKDIRTTIQTAVYIAKKEKKEVKEIVRIEDGTRMVTISVKPIKIPKHEDSYYIIVFKDTESFPTVFKELPKIGTKSAKDQQIRDLTEELATSKQQLQTVIEQQEATNEELRSTLEESQSSNEELMSTNEEMETTKEELQSANEELQTLNDELKDRNQKLNILNDDLTNLMNNIDTAVVIVDNNLHIRRFTESAQKLLRLLATDMGHKITDARLGIPLDNIEDLLLDVTNKLTHVRKEIKTEKNLWYQMRIRPYLTHDKKVNGAVLSFAEITEMKKLEQLIKDQTSKLLESESLAAIGKTAGMVGHDIRNPLQAIEGELYLAEKELAPRDSDLKHKMGKSIEFIRERLYYIDKIVKDLQDYAATSQPTLNKVDLKKLVEEVISSLKIPEEIKVSILINPDFPALSLDGLYMKRILTNLILNSIQAMPNGGKIIVEAIKKHDHASINIIDSGCGMSEETKKKIFVPLFTTKSKGQGFGLAVVKKLTDAINASISFESEEGKGTIFTITLPETLMERNTLE